jgi:hypothetical protein
VSATSGETRTATRGSVFSPSRHCRSAMRSPTGSATLPNDEENDVQGNVSTSMPVRTPITPCPTGRLLDLHLPIRHQLADEVGC